jgi:ubiquinone/menaquinone biosynthesis C-methylase UbiE
VYQNPAIAFGARRNEPVADLRQAWHTPSVRHAMEYIFRSDLFRGAPALGEAFIQRLDTASRSSKSNDELYADLRAYFLSIASRPEIRHSFSHHARERCQRRANQIMAILAQVQPGYTPESLLDVGSGNGAITSSLAEKLQLPKNKAIGAEIIAEPNLPPNISQIVFDGKKLPLSENTIDLSLLLSVIHHAEDYRPLLRDIHRVLKPGGRLIVREFNAPTPELRLLNLVMDHLFYRVFSDEPDVPNPGHFFSQERWLAIFKNIGFRLEKLFHPEPPKVNPYQPFIAVLKK